MLMMLELMMPGRRPDDADDARVRADDARADDTRMKAG